MGSIRLLGLGGILQLRKDIDTEGKETNEDIGRGGGNWRCKLWTAFGFCKVDDDMVLSPRYIPMVRNTIKRFRASVTV
jgi:hypothetical protein